MAEPAAQATWTCPTCGGAYPADFAVCPRDATPRADGTAANVDPLIGAVLGRTYRLVKVIGEGGMARLYEAEHLRVDAHFAVKVIHDDLATMPELLQRFEREARAAGKIRSEHVVRVIDVLRTTDGRPCIVNELLEGEDLQAYLDRKGKLAPAEAIPIARQICRAIAAAHACSVVHRDLKPSNVFLCKDEGEVIAKVLDFGVAKLEDDERLTRTDAVMGTPAYMAPEQARRAADAGPLSDVYTIGAVLYHMLTGAPPYGKVPAASRLAMLLHEEPARPRDLEPSIPAGVEAVVQHAMARDPAARTSSASALDQELAAFDATPAIGGKVAPAPKAAQADAITRAADRARPLAIALAIASSAAAGAWTALFTAAIVRPGAALTSTERTLVAIFAIAAIAGVAAIHVRMLRPRWRSAPSVMLHVRPVARALVAACATFGALELLTLGAHVVFDTGVGGVAVRAGAAGVAAALALARGPLRRRRRG